MTDLFNNIKKLDFSTYDGKEFCRETFLPFIEAFRNLDGQRTTEGASTIGSSTAELSDLKRLEEYTTEELEEGSEYFAVETSSFKTQKLDLAPDEPTEEIKHVMEEIKRLNASHGITTENIEYVQNMTRKDVTFSFSKVTSRNVPAFSELSTTNATLPQLPNESVTIGTTVAGLSTLSAYIIAPVLLVAAVTVGGCWFLHKKKREDSYDVEKAGVENEVEAPFSEEHNSLLDEVTIEPGTYRSFQLNNI
ncbi:MAG: hypothetical protein ACEY3A_00165 [Wolbachia sp.]